MAMFSVGAAYRRADIYEVLGVPEERQEGAWNRGYREWDGEMFIFATVGGTTSGFDYPNVLHPDGSMTWTGVRSSHSGQKQIQSVLDVLGHATHVFVREANRGPFVYLGTTRAAELIGDRPVQIHLHFGEGLTSRKSEARSFQEGTPRDVTRSRRERDPRARAACVDHWGSACVVCSLDAPWNHVHHLYPLSEGEREVSPVTDLRPVCPSCHAMIHWFRPILTIEEARLLWSTELVATAPPVR